MRKNVPASGTTDPFSVREAEVGARLEEQEDHPQSRPSFQEHVVLQGWEGLSQGAGGSARGVRM